MFCTNFHALTKWCQMHPNTTKRTETLVLGPMGWIGSVRCKKNPTWLHGTNFCINCTSSSRFAPCFMQLRKDPKWGPNTMKRTKTWVLGPMGWIRYFGCEKLQRDFIAQTFALIAPVQYVLQQVSCSYEMIPDVPKCYKTNWNISLVQWHGLCAFVAKNPDMTSWHELLH